MTFGVKSRGKGGQKRDGWPVEYFLRFCFGAMIRIEHCIRVRYLYLTAIEKHKL